MSIKKSFKMPIKIFFFSCDFLKLNDLDNEAVYKKSVH